MTHDGFDPQSSFRNEEINRTLGAQAHRLTRLDESPAGAQISHQGSVAMSSTTPVGPDSFGRLESRVVPSRWGAELRRHFAPSAATSTIAL